jgi:two-component system, OmpR family, response regulator
VPGRIPTTAVISSRQTVRSGRPILFENDPTGPFPGRTERVMSIANRTRHSLAVLVVDDSADTADSLAELLRLHGRNVRVAFDGTSALRSVAAEVPDVVFLDILMPPGPDGCEVAERIRAHCAGHKKQPLLIAVTGCGTEVDRLRSAGAGFDLHLVKPVDPAVLVGMTERFRRGLLAPSVPADELEPPAEEPPAYGSTGSRLVSVGGS